MGEIRGPHVYRLSPGHIVVSELASECISCAARLLDSSSTDWFITAGADVRASCTTHRFCHWIAPINCRCNRCTMNMDTQ